MPAGNALFFTVVCHSLCQELAAAGVLIAFGARQRRHQVPQASGSAGSVSGVPAPQLAFRPQFAEAHSEAPVQGAPWGSRGAQMPALQKLPALQASG
jgi:hypothetical protein